MVYLIPLKEKYDAHWREIFTSRYADLQKFRSCQLKDELPWSGAAVTSTDDILSPSFYKCKQAELIPDAMVEDTYWKMLSIVINCVWYNLLSTNWGKLPGSEDQFQLTTLSVLWSSEQRSLSQVRYHSETYRPKVLNIKIGNAPLYGDSMLQH